MEVGAWLGDRLVIVALYERIRDSLFLIPATIIAGLGVASRITLALDKRIPAGTAGLLSTSVDSARSILSTTATATITFAAIVFSMTAVVIQLATSQFSPRITQGFLRDRYQQVTIGLTVGTFVYSLVVLASVRGSGTVADSHHDLSSTVAVVLGVASMLAIVFFIDRIMRSMRIDTIVATLAHETEEAVRRLPVREPLGDERLTPPDTATTTSIITSHSGWIRSIAIKQMLAALPDETAVRLDVRVGEYIAAGELVAAVWPEVDEASAGAIDDTIEVDLTRTIASDPMHGFRQLIDVALRALSASINDPTTAADVVYHLTGPLRAVLLRELPGQVVHLNGRRAYLPRSLTHSEYVHGAFREIRINAHNQPHVLHALIGTLASLIDAVMDSGHEGRTEGLRTEARATLDVVRASTMPEADRRWLLDFAHEVGFEETEGSASSTSQQIADTRRHAGPN